MSIISWTQRKCVTCERERVHFRTTSKTAWQCIGKLKERVAAQPCAPKAQA